MSSCTNEYITTIEALAIKTADSKLCKSNAFHVIQNINDKKNEFTNNKINQNQYINYLFDIINTYS